MRILPLVSLLCAFTSSAALAQSLKPNEVMSTLAVHPLADAHPVLGSDNRTHLAYELVVTNPSPFFVTLDKVEAVAPNGAVLESLSAKDLSRMTTRYEGSDNLLAPGQTAIVFMDVSLVPGAAIPSTLSSRISISRQSAKDGKPAPYPAGSPVPPTATFSGAQVKPALLLVSSPRPFAAAAGSRSTAAAMP